ncbi:5-oxoprolinase [Folsomia candida]|uniref:5-oxoprolinase n=1 Tax=Folsomia candida TaxID=158441 RepID=A0A226EMG2_FOLCA|nr:5-oxoprolinase [Folsomia candida]
MFLCDDRLKLDISTVAAGGGSKLFFRSGMFIVGPESAGAQPGPVCYDKGGSELTITDANLVLGRILPEFFPKIFGPNNNMPLNKDKTLELFNKLTDEINRFLEAQNDAKRMTVHEVAMGYVRVANETMCRPIRAITQGKGYDTSVHMLACFGGAGGQHACAIASSLGISSVFVPKYAGILSAVGIFLADVVYEAQEPVGKVYRKETISYFDAKFADLEKHCTEHLTKSMKFFKVEIERFLHLRYDGTDCALMCLPKDTTNSETTSKYGDFISSFVERYSKEFGFTIQGRDIIVDDIRVRAVGLTDKDSGQDLEIADSKIPDCKIKCDVYFDAVGLVESPVYLLSELKSDHSIQGPAIIMDSLSTILIEPAAIAEITKKGDILVRLESSLGRRVKIGTELDTIQLSIFSHRFMRFVFTIFFYS